MPFRRSLIRNNALRLAQPWSSGLGSTAIDAPRGVMLLLCVFAVVWVGHLMSVALSLPMDNIEQLVWSHTLEWGYHKHPPAADLAAGPARTPEP